MAWIDPPPDTATPELERLTRRWRRQGTPVPPIVAVMKPSPRTLRAVLALNAAATFGGSVLGRRTEELVATAVSAFNDCFY